MTTRQHRLFTKIILLTALALNIALRPQCATADTAYANWPSTEDWVQHTNTVQQLFNAYNDRNAAKWSRVTDKLTPTFIYPYQDYVTLTTSIDSMVNCGWGYIDSSQADANGSLLTYFQSNPTNRIMYYTPATLHAAAGFTNWAIYNQPLRLWMGVNHNVQTQIWNALSLLKYTAAGVGRTSFDVLNYHYVIGYGTNRQLAINNLATRWMQPPSNYWNQSWMFVQTTRNESTITISGGGSSWSATGCRNWIYYQTPLLWAGALHTADFYYFPKTNSGMPTFSAQGANIALGMNMISGPAYSYSNFITSASALGQDVFGTVPVAGGTGTGSWGYQVGDDIGDSFSITRWSFPWYPEPTVAPNVEDLPDTDRDDVVDVGADVETFGADTGTISYRSDQDLPYVTIPLAATPSWYGGPPVHAYLSQGATTNLPYQYLVSEGSDLDGPYQAFSLSTRILDSGSVTTGGQKVKRAAVLRPRGNVVIFDFPWNDATSSFRPSGYPVGVNSNRTYVLQDLTPNADTDFRYNLVFASGIIHQFDKNSGAITNIVSVSGLNAPLALTIYPYASAVESFPGGSVTFPYTTSFPSTANDAKYNVTLLWTKGVVSQASYASKDGSQTITATITSDPVTKMITGISKSGMTGIDQSNASVAGNTITYNWGTLTRTQTAPAGQSRIVTLTAAPSGSPQITQQIAFNSRDLVTSVQTSVGSQNSTTTVQYNDSATGRYNNGFPKQAKINNITYPDLSTDTFAYDPSTGWLTEKDTPASASLTRSILYNYSQANGGDAANVSNLVERPRSVTVSLNGTAVAKTLYSYTGAAKTIIQQCVNASAAWGDAGNLTTTITNAIGGLTNGMPLCVAGPVVTRTWNYGIGGLSSGQFTSIGSLSATEVRTTGVTLSNTFNAFSYPVSGGIRKAASAGATAYETSGFNVTSADSFGRVLGAAYSDGTFETKSNYCLWGPQNITRRDQTAASVQYDLFGNVHTLTEPEISRVTTITADPLGLQTTCTIVRANVTRTYSEQKNLLGRTVNYSDPLSTNTWNYEQTGNGCWTITQQRFGLGNITTEVNADGSVSKMYGPGAEKCIGYAMSAQNGCPVLTATALEVDGTPKSESAAVVCNALGQPVSAQSAGISQSKTFEYNSFSAKPWRSTDESGIRSVMNWDTHIGAEKMGVKMDGADELVPAGVDRMFRFEYAVSTSNETRTTATYLQNNSGTETPLSTCSISHDGLSATMTFAGRSGSVAASTFSGPAAFTVDAVLPTGASIHETYGPLGIATRQQKDGNGSQTRLTTFTPDAGGRSLQIQDSVTPGLQTFSFDPAGRLFSSDESAAGGSSTTVQYLPGTDLPTSIIGGGKSWVCQYYPNGLPKIVSESGSPTAEYAWDTMGRLNSMTLTPASGTVVTTTWKRHPQTGRLTSKKVNGVTVETYAWRANGQPDMVSRANGTISNQYNAAGDCAAVVDTPANFAAETVTTTYNRAGDELTNAVSGGIAEGYTRHIDGTLLGVNILGNGVVPDHALDLPRNLASGQAQGFTLASGGQNRSAMLAYNPAAKISNITDGAASASYAWNPGGNATNITLTVAGVPRLTLNNGWNEALGVRTNIAYSVNGTQLASFAFSRGNGTNQITRITREDGSTREIMYDTTGRLASWKHKSAAGIADYDRSWLYSYDGAGNLIYAGRDTSITGGPPQLSTMSAEYATQNIRTNSEFTFDAYNFHTVRKWNAVDLICYAVTNARITANGMPARQFGNRFVISVPLAPSTTAHVTNLTVCAVVSAGTNLEYYTTNAIELTLPAYPETIETALASAVTSDSMAEYLYDARSQLRRVTDKAGTTTTRMQSTYDYYPDGRRARKTVKVWDGNAWQPYRACQLIYNQWNLIREVVTENGTTTTRDYAWGLDLSGIKDGQWGQASGGIGGLLAITEVVGASTNIFLPICDHIGTVHALVAAVTNNVTLAAPTVVATYDYTPYGELIAADGQYASSSPFGFSSKYRDSETGLIYYGYRYYDPRTGTWMSRDPKGEAGGVNLTAAFEGDPVNNIDPDGCDSMSISQPGGGYLSYSGSDYYTPWNLSGYRASTPLPPPPVIPQITAARPRPMLVPAATISVHGGSYLQSQSNGKLYGSLYEARMDGCWDNIESPPENGSLEDWQHYYARTGQWGKAGEVRDTQAAMLMLSLVPLPGRAGKVAAVPLERAAAAGLERRLAVDGLETFGVIGLDRLPTGALSSELSSLYLQRASSQVFQSKLLVHNKLAGFVGGRPVTADEIMAALANTEFREAGLLSSSVRQSGNGFLIGGSTRGGYFASEVADHELLHIGQFLRTPEISSAFPGGLVHEVIPSFVGSPGIYFGGTTLIVGGTYGAYLTTGGGK
jgi:RHS repeat-associated protein